MEWPTEDCYVVVLHPTMLLRGPYVLETDIKEDLASLDAAKNRKEKIGDSLGEIRIAKLVFVDLEKEGRVRIFSAESDFEAFCDEAELLETCQKIWDDPPGFTYGTEEAWDDFLKYIWIEYSGDRPAVRLGDFLEERGKM